MLKNVRVYITEAESYESIEVDEQYLRQGKKVEITYPNVAFITVVATSIPLPGVFRIGYMFEAKEAPIVEE